ncbi:reactive mitochondrial oxygen species modulator 1-domain-containing protein [Cantharellus anzutake]|uniref:reactive mitochondrial oxygen species modulator 1-domain-containing protein n=1 Tax=Cantharellus anzutake TaxID=1750568 RepID=UPI0019059784|nr:reactive mitochondrial oxygen species modulator 1-domain-containing protein [Cantharellus anzutake]KAF8334081.1 reactive mitochondrial oxygen species modulator 1-domain-containing protein [Cantharellus anzutake]
MPLPPPQQRGPYSEPTIWQKCKMGALMGCGVGLTIGFIFGSWSILRGGAGPRGALPTLSQYMLSSAATFGFFLSIGSAIRNDAGLIPPHMDAVHMKMMLTTPIIASRAEGAQRIRDRWENEFNVQRRLR